MRIREIEINNIKFYEFITDYKHKIKEIEKIVPKSIFLKIKKIQISLFNEFEKDYIVSIIYDFIKEIYNELKHLIWKIKNFSLQKGLKNLIIKEDIEEIEDILFLLEDILFLLSKKYKEEDEIYLIYLYYEELDKIKIKIEALKKFLDKILSEFSKLVYKTDKQTILNQWLRESEKIT